MKTVSPEITAEINPTRPVIKSPQETTQELLATYDKEMLNGVPAELKERGIVTWIDDDGSFYIAQRDPIEPDTEGKEKLAVLKVPEKISGTTVNLGEAVTRWALFGLPGSEGLEQPHPVDIYRKIKVDYPKTAEDSSIYYSDPKGINTLYLNGHRQK